MDVSQDFTDSPRKRILIFLLFLRFSFNYHKHTNCGEKLLQMLLIKKNFIFNLMAIPCLRLNLPKT